MNYKILVFSIILLTLLLSCDDKKITNPIQGEPELTSITPSSGYIGDIITINGKNFGESKGTSFIRLNSIKVVEYVKWSDTEIKFKIPIGVSSGGVFVNVGGIQSNQNNLQILYYIENGTFTDVEGTIYKTVKIGNQIWMAENLNVSHYSNGDLIPQIESKSEWANLTIGAWCYYNNDPENGAIYGKLYNWYAVNDTRGLAPAGWHIPSDEDWQTLTNYLGGESIAVNKLIEVGTAHWNEPNTWATNETGFSALPGGYRFSDGTCDDIGKAGYWCACTEYSSTDSWSRKLDESVLFRGICSKKVGRSIRLVKD
jgi:uncharacterized protein (TIGR02145 family)